MRRLSASFADVDFVSLWNGLGLLKRWMLLIEGDVAPEEGVEEVVTESFDRLKGLKLRDLIGGLFATELIMSKSPWMVVYQLMEQVLHGRFVPGCHLYFSWRVGGAEHGRVLDW